MSRWLIQIRTRVSRLLDDLGIRIMPAWKPVLQRALGDVTAAAQDMQRSVVPGSTVLFLAPHPDDEFFGCPAFMLTLVGQGCKITLLTATDGERFTATGCGSRLEESTRVAKSKHWSHVALHLPDGNLGSNITKLDAGILETIADSDGHRFDMIVAPMWCDYHRDHRALGMSLLRVVRKLPYEIRPSNLVLYYTMAFPTRVPALMRPLVLGGEEWLDMIASWRCAYICSMSESAVRLWMTSRRVIGDIVEQRSYGEVVLLASANDVELLCEAALNGEADAASLLRGRFALTNLARGLVSGTLSTVRRGR